MLFLLSLLSNVKDTVITTDGVTVIIYPNSCGKTIIVSCCQQSLYDYATIEISDREGISDDTRHVWTRTAGGYKCYKMII